MIQKPMLRVRDWLKPEMKGVMVELNSPWLLGQRQ